ncbi:MAG: hypothetical protein ACJASL_002063 [Paraglaciecola sp.]|jgi:hypothetical protein
MSKVLITQSLLPDFLVKEKQVGRKGLRLLKVMLTTPGLASLDKTYKFKSMPSRTH